MRIIPSLLLNNRALVKTVSFSGERYLGDPINAVRLFNEYDAHEIVILDINCNEPDFEYLEKLASKCRMPVAYGGGINTLEQALKVIKLGYDKVILSRLLLKNPDEVEKIVSHLGSQSVIACIEIERDNKGVLGLRLHKKISLVNHIRQVSRIGVGEFFLYDSDREGSRKGLLINDFLMLKDEIDVPVIIGGGVASYNELRELSSMGLDAVAVGSLFVFFGKREAVLINYDLRKYGLY